MRRRKESPESPGDADCSGVKEVASGSLANFVRSLAHPQRSTALVLGLSLIAVGVQTWEEEIVLSRALVLIGLLIAPAAVRQLPPPAEVLEPILPSDTRALVAEAGPTEIGVQPCQIGADMCSPLASLLPTQGGKQKEVEPNGCGSKLKSQGKPQVCVGFHLPRCNSG
ncbi:unnamed protein product [Effrenium voratum]|uniref:Uncharacterized protein n=1 Tax=Effrenium voratum TaxID=2562239 RepID=A0AA36JB78_9DINO|nr:unnamed protein product [Effrenium voratum]CAJ1427000.1 unnamed protein product [Effrenium voratum]